MFSFLKNVFVFYLILVTHLLKREREGSAVFNNVKMAELSNYTKCAHAQSHTLCLCGVDSGTDCDSQFNTDSYLHRHQVRCIYKRGSKGEVRERECLSHTRTPSRFHTPTHSRPKIRSQVWGNCTQQRVVPTSLWKLESHNHPAMRGCESRL